MAVSRTRLLEAAYTCVGRYGIAKTTMDDVAREASLSRATLYRHFPGGKDQLIAEVVAWEAQRFLERLAAAVDDAADLPTLFEEALVFAARAVEGHDVLQKVLETEPELLLPLLTTNQSRLLFLIEGFLVPRLPEAHRDAAPYLARMVLTYIQTPGSWAFSDPAEVRELVRTQFLAPLRDRRL